MEFDINYWAVLVAGLSSMLTGFLWYGPLFSKPWMKEMGFDPNDAARMAQMKEAAKTAYVKQLIGALVMSFVFAHVLIAFESNSIAMALQGALWTWLGFIVPVKMSDTIWGGKSMKLFWIDSLYYLLNLAVMGVILTVWR